MELTELPELLPPHVTSRVSRLTPSTLFDPPDSSCTGGAAGCETSSQYIPAGQRLLIRHSSAEKTLESLRVFITADALTPRFFILTALPIRQAR